jgi:hypothetical protein
VVTLGYERLDVGDARIVARKDLLAAFAHAIQRNSLYEWAAAHPERRSFAGRLPAYAVRLPLDGPAAVIRHNHHGGLMARLRGDRFILPRAPRELMVASYLAQHGVATPVVLGFVVYRESFWVKRADVATEELPNGMDLGALLAEPGSQRIREEIWDAVRDLLRQLAAVGAWHPDLNAKNIHVSRTLDGQLRAAVLDVDRVRLGEPGEIVARANRDRLRRSLRKLEAQCSLALGPSDWAALTIATGAA